MPLHATMRRKIFGVCLMLVFAGDVFKPTKVESSISYGDCRTPDNFEGDCIYLSECSILYNILKAGSITEDERTFLQSSQCGYHGKKILICCPKIRANYKSVPSRSSLLPEPPNCPIQFQPRIFGGHDTEFYELPWLTMIEYTKPDNSKGFHCGGGLINDRYVLTAAHCAKGSSVKSKGWRITSVRLGEWDTRTNPDCVYNAIGAKDCADPHVNIAVEKIIVHPMYDGLSRNNYHDIALIRLAEPVGMSTFIRPICLPHELSLRDGFYEQHIVDVAGWGATEIANNSPITRTANLNVWNINDCKKKYETINVTLGDGQMCAGGQEGVDTCNGDSGGPLTYIHRMDRPYYIMVGIVSFGPAECGLRDWPGIYTRVGYYLNWIRANIY